ncbi:MAG: hypothetical protein JWL80_75 [Parcubacteria group bacterium]|nr:hypothetical protein [Parcubacteria group bacterium]
MPNVQFTPNQLQRLAELLPMGDVQSVVNWDVTEVRRDELIKKIVCSYLTAEEEGEFNYLQNLDDIRLRVLYPLTG